MDMTDEGLGSKVTAGFIVALVALAAASLFGANPVLAQLNTCNGLVVTVDLAAGQTATSGDDVILGTNGVDTIVAFGGNDTICGLAGDDVINAGPGNDFVDSGDGDDTVFGLDGDDTINSGNGNDEVISGNGNDSINAGPGNDTLNGGSGNDTLLGAANDDTIFGQSGNDTISGNGGNDFIVGAGGSDVISGGPGNDVLNGGNDEDTVNGGPGNDTLFGLGGNDTLLGAANDDSIFGQGGDDFINGNGGDDQLLGNEGNDTITDPFGTNTLNGGAGNDKLTGGTGADQIFGDGNLGQAGHDILEGRGGVDLLIGFAGNDVLRVTDGLAETANGGPGLDVCTSDAVDTLFNCNVTDPRSLFTGLNFIALQVQGGGGGGGNPNPIAENYVCNTPLGVVVIGIDAGAETITAETIETTIPEGLTNINGTVDFTGAPPDDGNVTFAATVTNLETGQDVPRSSVFWEPGVTRKSGNILVPEGEAVSIRFSPLRSFINSGNVTANWILTVPGCAEECAAAGGDIFFNNPVTNGNDQFAGCYSFGPEFGDQSCQDTLNAIAEVSDILDLGLKLVSGPAPFGPDQLISDVVYKTGNSICESAAAIGRATGN